MTIVTLNDGSQIKIRFKHIEQSGRRITRCTIAMVINDIEITPLMAEAISSPVPEILTKVPENIAYKDLQTYYGRAFKRSLTADTGEKFAVLKGDQFSKAKGRKIALRKALEALSRADRKLVWAAAIQSGDVVA